MNAKDSLDRETIYEWVRRSCEEQGVPFHVTDPATIKQVVTLLKANE